MAIDINVIAKSLRKWLSPEFYSEADIYKMSTGMKEALETKSADQPDHKIRSVGLAEGERQEEAKEFGVQVPGAAPSQQPGELSITSAAIQHREFEQWAIREDMGLDFTMQLPDEAECDCYTNQLTDAMWQAWKGAISLKREVQQPPVELPLNDRASGAAYQAAADWLSAFKRENQQVEDRYPHYPMIAAALQAYITALPEREAVTQEELTQSLYAFCDGDISQLTDPNAVAMALIDHFDMRRKA